MLMNIMFIDYETFLGIFNYFHLFRLMLMI